MSESKETKKTMAAADGGLFSSPDTPEVLEDSLVHPAARVEALPGDKSNRTLDLKGLAEEGAEAVKKDGGRRGGSKAKGKGMTLTRHFSQEGVHPFDELEWEIRSASITNDKGESLFCQNNVEIPAAWSQMATNVVVSKYFRGGEGSADREHSVRQLIGRVANTISDWGIKDHYFSNTESAEIFRSELTHLLVNQAAAFNSPVWFNLGVEETPQCSACFINSVEDSMSSILDLAKTESTAAVPEAIFPPCVPAEKPSQPVVWPAGLSLSCAALMLLPVSSKVVVKPVGPRKWSSLTWITRTLKNSSIARLRKRKKPGP